MKSRLFSCLLVSPMLLLGCNLQSGSTNTSIPNPNSEIPKVDIVASLESGGGAKALSDAVAIIKAGKGVADCYVAPEGTTIVIVLLSGQTGYILTDNKDQTSTDTSQLSSPKSISYGVPGLRSSASSAVSGQRTIVPSHKTAVIYAPFQAVFRTNYSDVRSDLQYAGYAVTEYYDSNANLANLVNAFRTGYGVIIIDTHGGLLPDSDYMFLTADKYEVSALNSISQPDREGVTFGSHDGKTYLCGVTRRFVDRYSYNQSIIFVNSCMSLKNSTMSDAFLGGGASAYLGWTDTINGLISNAAVVDFFHDLKSVGETVAGAFDYVKNDFILRFVSADGKYFNSAFNIGLFAYTQSSSEDVVLTSASSNSNLSGTWKGTWRNTLDNSSGAATVNATVTGTTITGTLVDETNGITDQITKGYVSGTYIYIEAFDSVSNSSLAYTGNLLDSTHANGTWYAMAGGYRLDYGSWDLTKS